MAAQTFSSVTESQDKYHPAIFKVGTPSGINLPLKLLGPFLAFGWANAANIKLVYAIP